MPATCTPKKRHHPTTPHKVDHKTKKSKKVIHPPNNTSGHYQPSTTAAKQTKGGYSAVQTTTITTSKKGEHQILILPIPKDSIPENNRPVLLRSRRCAALVHPAEPAAAVGGLLRCSLILSLFDEAERAHFAAHHDGTAAAGTGTRLAVAAGSDAARGRSRSAGFSAVVLRIRGWRHAQTVGVWR